MTMKHPAIASLVAGAALLLSACGTAATADAPPATIIPVAGTLAGLEFLHPLAVTMLGGLASLVVVQAFLLPAFLMMTAGRARESAPAPSAQGLPETTHTAAVPD